MLTLQGAVAHCDMPVESGPTMLLPHSHKYIARHLPTLSRSPRPSALWFRLVQIGPRRCTPPHHLPSLSRGGGFIASLCTLRDIERQSRNDPPEAPRGARPEPLARWRVVVAGGSDGWPQVPCGVPCVSVAGGACRTNAEHTFHLQSALRRSVLAVCSSALDVSWIEVLCGPHRKEGCRTRPTETYSSL